MFPKCWLSTLADKSIDGKMVSRQNPVSHSYPCFRFWDRETSRPSFLTASIWFFSFCLIFVFLLQSLMQILLVASTLYSPLFFSFLPSSSVIVLWRAQNQTASENLHMEIVLRQNVFHPWKSVLEIFVFHLEWLYRFVWREMIKKYATILLTRLVDSKH